MRAKKKNRSHNVFINYHINILIFLYIYYKNEFSTSSFSSPSHIFSCYSSSLFSYSSSSSSQRIIISFFFNIYNYSAFVRKKKKTTTKTTTTTVHRNVVKLSVPRGSHDNRHVNIRFRFSFYFVVLFFFSLAWHS